MRWYGKSLTLRLPGQIYSQQDYTVVLTKILKHNIYNVIPNVIHILWDKIARPHRKPFGLFYPLETCFSSYFFIHRTLHLLFLCFWLFWNVTHHAPLLANSESKRVNMFLKIYTIYIQNKIQNWKIGDNFWNSVVR